MPTNDERREVAASLREFAADCKDEACDSMHFAMYTCWSDKGVCEAYNTSEALTRLADLIEPEPERTCRIENIHIGPCYCVTKFSCCSEEWVESNSDPNASMIDGIVCPRCGARVVE